MMVLETLCTCSLFNCLAVVLGLTLQRGKGLLAKFTDFSYFVTVSNILLGCSYLEEWLREGKLTFGKLSPNLFAAGQFKSWTIFKLSQSRLICTTVSLLL